MRNKKEEETIVDSMDSTSIEIMDNNEEMFQATPIEIIRPENTKTEEIEEVKSSGKKLVNCLRNSKVIVRFIRKPKGNITDPRHVLYGGMSENATRTFCTPILSSGRYVNVLTDEEKDYLEYVMGLKPNALSIYAKVDNFWDNNSPMGISNVRLTKRDTYLDLSNPEEYIKYKILLANKDLIAPSLEALQDFPKATYQFVLIEEGAENKVAAAKMSTTIQCYKEYGKIETDRDILRTIIEIIEGRPIGANSKLEFLQSKINDLIQADSKLFLKIVQDPHLNTKVLIKKAVDEGYIAKRGNYYYLKSDNSPLCENNQEPVFNTAAQYLNSPKRQEILFALQAKLK